MNNSLGYYTEKNIYREQRIVKQRKALDSVRFVPLELDVAALSLDVVRLCRAVCCKRSCFRWFCLILSGLRTFLCYDVIWSDEREKEREALNLLGSFMKHCFFLKFLLDFLCGSYTWIRKGASLICGVWTSDFSGPACELEQISLNQNREVMDEREGKDYANNIYFCAQKCLLELH